jgi:hypothetical protein
MHFFIQGLSPASVKAFNVNCHCLATGEKFEGLVRTSEEVLRDFDYFRELSL